MKTSIMNRWLAQMLLLGLVCIWLNPDGLEAQPASFAGSEEFPRWSLNGSALYQFQADLDRGGNFSAKRFSINGRWSHQVNSSLSLGAGLRYAYEGYSFSDHPGFSGGAPWGDIHMPDLSLAAFYRTESDWRFLAAATGGFSGESGADPGDSIIYGGILSASKRIGSDLTLGLGAGIYRVIVTGQDICTATDSAAVTLDSSCRELVFPSAFSPNGDGLNDRFGPMGSVTAVKQYKLNIYNRWGQLVFYSQQPVEQWDGRLLGKPGETALFTWYCEYVLPGQTMTRKKGTLLLIR